MIDHDWKDAIGALVRMRAQVEASMPDMNVPGESGCDATALHKAWKHLGGAIDHLRSIEGAANSARGLGSNAPAPNTPDDLTSIRGISAELADHLALLGVTRYSAIASWRADDVRRVTQALGLTREISHQNWIEQAALLERRRASGENEALRPRRSDAELSASAATTSAQAPNASPRSQEPSKPANEAPFARGSERNVAPSKSPAPAAQHLEQPSLAYAATSDTMSSRLSPQAPRIPTVSASPHVSTDAPDRARRRQEQEQPHVPNPQRAGEPLPSDADEAAVMFFVREQTQSERSTVESTIGKRPKLLARTQRADTGPAAYVANAQATEEAEVVVIKSRVQGRDDVMEHREGAPMRRLLKAWLRR